MYTTSQRLCSGHANLEHDGQQQCTRIGQHDRSIHGWWYMIVYATPLPSERDCLHAVLVTEERLPTLDVSFSLGHAVPLWIECVLDSHCVCCALLLFSLTFLVRDSWCLAVSSFSTCKHSARDAIDGAEGRKRRMTGG